MNKSVISAIFLKGFGKTYFRLFNGKHILNASRISIRDDCILSETSENIEEISSTHS